MNQADRPGRRATWCLVALWKETLDMHVAGARPPVRTILTGRPSVIHRGPLPLRRYRTEPRPLSIEPTAALQSSQGQ